MNYFSGFTGIGGFEKGIKQAYENVSSAERQQQRRDSQPRYSADNGQVVVGTQRPACAGFSEIDRYAVAIYRYHYPEHKNFGDATKIIPADLPDFDFFCAGFPCQSFSIAGKRAGFDDTRGTMFFEIARILSHKRPPHFLLENVKGLLSHDAGKTYQSILGILSDLGYFVETVVLNSKDYGVPQNRERIFFIGHLAERCEREILSFGNGDEAFISQEYERALSGTISTKNQSGQCNFDGSTTLIYSKDGKQKNKSFASCLTGGGHSGGNHSDMDLIAFCDSGDGRETQIRTSILPPLRANSGAAHNNSIYRTGQKIRRLTPVECERLQGFPDDWTKYGLFENEIKEISDSQRYKVCGNSVTTFVVEAVISQMLKAGCLEILFS